LSTGEGLPAALRARLVIQPHERLAAEVHPATQTVEEDFLPDGFKPFEHGSPLR
jgi:hypothetical protein